MNYFELLPSLFELHVGNFYVALARESHRKKVLEFIGRNIQPGQRVFVGVIAPIAPRIETAEEVRDRVLAADDYIPLDQPGTTEDCGLPPFAMICPLPGKLHCFALIRARIEGTLLAAAQLNG